MSACILKWNEQTSALLSRKNEFDFRKSHFCIRNQMHVLLVLVPLLVFKGQSNTYYTPRVR